MALYHSKQIGSSARVAAGRSLTVEFTLFQIEINIMTCQEQPD
jgi:hypothetical protein